MNSKFITIGIIFLLFAAAFSFINPHKAKEVTKNAMNYSAFKTTRQKQQTWPMNTREWCRKWRLNCANGSNQC